MQAFADQITLVSCADSEFDRPAIHSNHFGSSGGTHAHRCGSNVGNIEMRSKTLMPFRQQTFNGCQRRRLKQVDHHRCCQHSDAAGPHEGRRVFVGDYNGLLTGRAKWYCKHNTHRAHLDTSFHRALPGRQPWLHYAWCRLWIPKIPWPLSSPSQIHPRTSHHH